MRSSASCCNDRIQMARFVSSRLLMVPFACVSLNFCTLRLPDRGASEKERAGHLQHPSASFLLAQRSPGVPNSLLHLMCPLMEVGNFWIPKPELRELFGSCQGLVHLPIDFGKEDIETAHQGLSIGRHVDGTPPSLHRSAPVAFGGL